MQETYEAILRGDHLQWSGKARPSLADPNRPVPVRVTILDDAASGRGVRGRSMAEPLEQLAASHALASLKDPISWEREVRRERPLPDRDG